MSLTGFELVGTSIANACLAARLEPSDGHFGDYGF
jgi:hypothetical protein